MAPCVLRSLAGAPFQRAGPTAPVPARQQSGRGVAALKDQEPDTSLPDAARAATVIASSALFSLAVCLSYGLMRRRAAHPASSVALVALGSFYLYWWVWPGQFGHAVAIGVSTLYVWMWSKSLDRHEARTWVLLGALAGLVSIVRWQNAILPLLSLVWRWRRTGASGALWSALPCSGLLHSWSFSRR